MNTGHSNYGPSQSEKPTVRGGRSKNTDYRQREYLTEAEVEKLLATAGESRNPVRDRLLILMAFRDALRVSELVDSRWQQFHLDTATIDIPRAKNGTPGIHGLQGDELRLLRALRREHPHADFVFLSERKVALSPRQSLAAQKSCRLNRSQTRSPHSHSYRRTVRPQRHAVARCIQTTLFGKIDRLQLPPLGGHMVI